MERINWLQVFKTTLEMMKVRGYTLDIPSTFKKEPLEDFDIICNDDNDFPYIIFFVNSDNLGINKLEECIEKMDDESIEQAVIVHRTGIVTPKSEKQLSNLRSIKFIQVFPAENLMYNITESDLVSPHVKLSQKDKERVVNNYGGKESNFPKIPLNDPVIKYYGFRSGDLIRITRKKGDVFYRLVK